MKGRFIICAAAVMLVCGCSLHSVRSETGNPISQSDIAKLQDGQTTATEVLGLFGAPSSTSSVGRNEVYVYKHCRTGGMGVTVIAVGQTNSKELCNRLTVTIDRETGVMMTHNYQSMF